MIVHATIALLLLCQYSAATECSHERQHYSSPTIRNCPSRVKRRLDRLEEFARQFRDHPDDAKLSDEYNAESAFPNLCRRGSAQPKNSSSG